MPETSTSLGAPESQVTEVENAQIDTQMFQALVNNTDEIEGLLENIDGNTDGIEGLLADILVVLEDCCGDDNGNNNYVPPEPCLECDWNPTGLGDDSLDGPGTDTASWIGQSNFLIDEDYVGPNGSAGNGPEVVNFNSANQSVTADGGFADADDGIGDVDFSTDGTGEYHVGDDYSMVGSASASADGVADGDLVTQDLATGANGQLTDFGIDIVGADANNFDVGGDNEFGLLASDGLAMTETDTETYVYQANLMGDTDDVIDAQVLNAGDGSATQSVSASGGEGAFAEDGIDAFVEGTEAVDADPVPGVVSAGDNVTIDGSTSGSADALAFGELLTQEIDTGLNGQQNQVLASIVGGDQNSISAGDDQDLMGEITVSGDDSADTNSLFMVDQFNELEDSDLVDNASVANNGIANQSVTANGGLASAQDGFDAKTAELEIEAGDSVFVAGSASASADATAVGDMLSQDITTGGNGQSNLTSASIVGGDQNLASVGDDQSLIGEFGFGKPTRTACSASRKAILRTTLISLTTPVLSTIPKQRKMSRRSVSALMPTKASTAVRVPTTTTLPI
ncbi:hypothetical protein [Oricola sp.]|uniref:hypothetical protein n=1 Tax=Oricola sp. TaxID=1979950 RepID=UPI003BAB39C7